MPGASSAQIGRQPTRVCGRVRHHIEFDIFPEEPSRSPTSLLLLMIQVDTAEVAENFLQAAAVGAAARGAPARSWTSPATKSVCVPAGGGQRAMPGYASSPGPRYRDTLTKTGLARSTAQIWARPQHAHQHERTNYGASPHHRCSGYGWRRCAGSNTPRRRDTRMFDDPLQFYSRSTRLASSSRS